MAAGDPLTSVSDLIAMATASTSETVIFSKKMNLAGGGATTAFGFGANAVRQLLSLWRQDGQPAGATAIPSTAAVCTNATTGALRQATPASGARKYILNAFLAAGVNAACTAVFYDRLSHQGGLSGTATGAQTTNLPTAALTRRTTGVGVEPWIEVYSSVGNTTATISASYTNDAGTTGQTTGALLNFVTGSGIAAVAERLVPLPLQLGSTDKGCRAVASVTLSASTGTAGNFGVTLAFPLFLFSIPLNGVGPNVNMVRAIGAPLSLGVDSDSCLSIGWFVSAVAATTNFELFGMLAMGEK